MVLASCKIKKTTHTLVRKPHRHTKGGPTKTNKDGSRRQHAHECKHTFATHNKGGPTKTNAEGSRGQHTSASKVDHPPTKDSQPRPTRMHQEDNAHRCKQTHPLTTSWQQIRRSSTILQQSPTIFNNHQRSSTI